MRPSREVEEALIGTMLGDSQFSLKSNTLSCGHSYKQLPYLLHKAELLGVEMKTKFRLVKETASIKFHATANPFLREFGRRFYTPKKRITDENLRGFSLISLAYLFMDDGHLTKKQVWSEIATCCFTKKEVEKLVAAIDRLGVVCTISKGKYPRIYINAENTRRLSKMIAPYVHQTMNYKLLPEDREVPKIALDMTDKPYFDEWEIVRSDYTPKWVYCIDVAEHHNFITTSGVVHNCRCPNNRAPASEEVANCRPFLELQLKTLAPQLIVCLGTSAAQGLLGTDSSISHLRGRLFDYERGPLKCKVLCTYHPSYVLHIPEEDKERKKAAKTMIWSDLKVGLKYLREYDGETDQYISAVQS